MVTKKKSIKNYVMSMLAAISVSIASLPCSALESKPEKNNITPVVQNTPADQTKTAHTIAATSIQRMSRERIKEKQVFYRKAIENIVFKKRCSYMAGGAIVLAATCFLIKHYYFDAQNQTSQATPSHPNQGVNGANSRTFEHAYIQQWEQERQERTTFSGNFKYHLRNGLVIALVTMIVNTSGNIFNKLSGGTISSLLSIFSQGPHNVYHDVKKHIDVIFTSLQVSIAALGNQITATAGMQQPAIIENCFNNIVSDTTVLVNVLESMFAVLNETSKYLEIDDNMYHVVKQAMEKMYQAFNGFADCVEFSMSSLSSRDNTPLTTNQQQPLLLLITLFKHLAATVNQSTALTERILFGGNDA